MNSPHFHVVLRHLEYWSLRVLAERRKVIHLRVANQPSNSRGNRGLGHARQSGGADALAAAQQARQDPLYVCMWALPELIEAAVRNGKPQAASDALERLAETTQVGGSDYGLGIEARSRALLSDGEAADGLYREAIDRLSRTRLHPSSPCPSALR